jgi:hypothetical protein
MPTVRPSNGSRSAMPAWARHDLASSSAPGFRGHSPKICSDAPPTGEPSPSAESPGPRPRPAASAGSAATTRPGRPAPGRAGADVNDDAIDPDAYRRWWETEGRGDLATCPCGQPADDLTLDSPGFCLRHTHMAIDREGFASAILEGTFGERDLTEEESKRAQRVADGS